MGLWDVITECEHACINVYQVYIFGDSFFFSFVSNVCVGCDLLSFIGVCGWVSVCDCVCGCENILTCRCIIAIKAAGAQGKNCFHFYLS